MEKEKKEKIEKEKKVVKNKYLYAKGARKTSVAQVRLYRKGSGNFEVNGKKFNEYFRTENLQRIFLAALTAVNHLQDIDLTIKTQGGGITSQSQACRHGIARALVELDKELRPLLRAEGFLTRDPRVKERKKPGLKRARKAPQWSKR
ncbi:MAG: 30S ribosomal protein S9 [Patescibacteria group bacterium]